MTKYPVKTILLPAAAIVLLLASCKPRNTSDYPIGALSLKNITLTDSFWSPRIKRNQEITIPAVLEKLHETGRIKNFTNAGKVLSGQSESEEFCTAFPFDDSDVYKLIDAGSLAIMNIKDMQASALLEARLDSLITVVAEAQEPDGYLYTARTMNPKVLPDMSGKERFISEQDNSHELYNLGHLYEAACSHFEATGKRTLLDIAIRSADFLCQTFLEEKLVRYPGHEEIETGLAHLYKTTGKKEYLELLRFFLEVRGPGGQEYNQAHLKPIDQHEAVGHAVRGMYLYSGMTEFSAINQDSAYLKTLTDLWADIIRSKTYITGGVGSKSSNEGFGDPYDLPNHTAYCETCSSIGFILWNERMFRATGEGKYIDMLEKTLYNAFLSGISLDGNHFFYPNPLESWGKKTRPDWYACACCPPNVARLIPMVPRFVYATTDQRIYCNLYAAGTANLTIQGKPVTLTQHTDYPWDGNIEIEISVSSELNAEILLRIPGWADNRAFESDLYSFTLPDANVFSVTINNKAVSGNITNGYFPLNRKWENGDRIRLELPMPVRLVKANPKVTADVGKVAVQRGPILYCAESADHDRSVLTASIDSATLFIGGYIPELLGGIYSIYADVNHYTTAASRSKSHLAANATGRMKLKLIPYFAWANREPGEMAVWFAEKPEFITRFPEPPGLESKAKASASYAYDNSLPYLNDGIDPVNSADRGNNAFRLHPHKGTQEWVSYEFDKPIRVSAVKVYWLEDGSYWLPASWTLSYRKPDGSWAPVDSFSPYLIEKDQYNEVTFVAVNTTGLRIDLTLGNTGPGGIIEWKVN